MTCTNSEYDYDSVSLINSIPLGTHDSEHSRVVIIHFIHKCTIAITMTLLLSLYSLACLLFCFSIHFITLLFCTFSHRPSVFDSSFSSVSFRSNALLCYKTRSIALSLHEKPTQMI